MTKDETQPQTVEAKQIRSTGRATGMVKPTVLVPRTTAKLNQIYAQAFILRHSRRQKSQANFNILCFWLNWFCANKQHVSFTVLQNKRSPAQEAVPNIINLMCPHVAKLQQLNFLQTNKFNMVVIFLFKQSKCYVSLIPGFYLIDFFFFLLTIQPGHPCRFAILQVSFS